uniref:Uncharacterized protein n=1 Tax=Scophthalmus maximus TaxID=52904 RepID=A0A8D3DRR4_SCOMX
NMDFSIRAANQDDCRDIARIQAPNCFFQIVFSHKHADLEQDGFSTKPFFHGIVAEVPEQHKAKEGEGGPSVTQFFLQHSRMSPARGEIHLNS